ncbi:MAG: DUF1080 domain-containing protein [Candidatus Brocadiae bacterium]|nr:DUF1080 domain-containing protein [Candidatus Brocadiia bacterium]
MERWMRIAVGCALVAACWCTVDAGEGADGWTVLFNGTDLDAWNCKKGGWVIDDDKAMARQPKGGYAWSKERFGDFVLDLDFKVAEGCNSGIFIRTANLRNVVQTGIEVQVLDSFGKKQMGKHDCGAIYDCLAPSANAVKKPGEWNHITITCNDNLIQVVLNGQKIIDMDLDKWAEAKKNPDGSKNKFRTAYKDMAREGHIGFQDHGKPVWYRNVKIKPLATATK